MPKPQKRDRAYFERRLRNEFPAIYADFLAGKFGTINAAAKAAGLIKSPSGLEALQRAWKRASPTERKQFIAGLRSAAGKPSPVAARPRPAVTPDRYVLDWAKKRILEIMAKQGLSETDVMRELGPEPSNTSLWRAIGSKRGPTRIAPELARALEKWLDKNRNV
ncbi:hypothetical protein MAXJ12_29380 [Mesorhizobium alhagi CCNWXJ12-2]|uniref:Uncharacterized protein n=1 Tax=Mesorhizobium alhagi CCNWXJ12-2 TaxID=1107882 RepID=H0I089_9HYPH|nr:hypothetical protein MAXJ12_29380 [Mesorhizobium alhagi CCNWXJ12-2]